MGFLSSIGLGLNVGSALEANRAQRDQAREMARRAKLNNKLREANNIREAAVANLNRHVQSLQNRRVLEAGGEQYNQLAQTLMKQDDVARVQKFELNVQSAEAAGRVAVAGALAGNRQGAADLVDAIRLQEDRQIESMQSAQSFQSERGAQALASITADAASSLDMRMVFPNFDWNIDQAPKGPSGGFLGVLANAGMMTASQIGLPGIASLGQGMGMGSWFQPQPTSYEARGWFNLG